MNEIVIREYSKKWGYPIPTVNGIYMLLEQSGAKYGKVRRALVGFGVQITSRQLRYFYKKNRLYNRLDVEHKGKPANFVNLIKKI